MLEQKTQVRIRYAETDQMGVVYHGNYAQFFEIGRTEWLRSFETTYKTVEENGIMLPVINLQCEFKKSAYYDDVLEIKTSLKKIPSVKIEFEHTISNQNNQIICTGKTVLVFIDTKTKKPTRCPDFILEKIIKSQLN